MLLMILLLALIFGLISFSFKLTGAILSGFVWAFIKLPLALFFGTLGIAFFATLILIPLGILCFKMAGCLVCPCV